MLPSKVYPCLYRTFLRGVDEMNKWNKDVVFCCCVRLQDADILWFRDPFPNFSDDSDFQIACDKYSGGPFDVATNAPNGGFLFVRSNQRTIALYRYWYAARLRVPGKHDQDVLSVVIKEKDFARLGVRIRFLETLYFSGFCQVWQSTILLFTRSAC